MANLERYSEETPKNTNTYKTATWILSALLLFAVVGAVVFAMNNNELKDETSELNTTVTDLNSMKKGLETELADLEGDYNTTIDENENLKVTIEERVAEIEVLQNKIRQVRNQLKNNETNSTKMQERLAQLEQFKDSLQLDVQSLRGENTELVAAREELTKSLEGSRERVSNLSEQVLELTQMNQQMTDRLYRMAPAGFTAGNFAVNIEKGNDKVTAKARKAREITVNFDLPYVPTEKQGKTEIYLVVTDVYGNPVKSTSTSTVKVPTPQDNLKVEAVDIEKLNLKESQSLAMSFEPESKMDAGEYHLMIYSDEGYLGSTGFRLR